MRSILRKLFSLANFYMQTTQGIIPVFEEVEEEEIQRKNVSLESFPHQLQCNMDFNRLELHSSSNRTLISNRAQKVKAR